MSAAPDPGRAGISPALVREDQRSWSPRQWGVAVTGLLAIQLILIGVLGSGNVGEPPPPAAAWGPRLVEWVPDSADAERALSVLDPTLFALPNELGFSGAAWRAATDFPAPDLGWTDPPRWVAGRSNWFVVPGPADASRVTAPLTDAARPMPRPLRLEVRPVPMPVGTLLEVGQGLAERGLERPLTLPSMVHSNLLAATEVEVSVEPDGQVFSAVVLKSSGFEAADQQALALARSARFKALAPVARPTTELQWGRLRFQWHTLGAAPPSP